MNGLHNYAIFSSIDLLARYYLGRNSITKGVGDAHANGAKLSGAPFWIGLLVIC